MRIIDASTEIIRPKSLEDKSHVGAIYRLIEEAGRECYQSSHRITEDSAARFVADKVRRGHESVLEHATMTVRFIVNRGVSHEIVRHRIAAISQESTRYCNYIRDDFGSEITVIRPYYFKEGSPSYFVWEKACAEAERAYFALLEIGEPPERARGVLPHDLKTSLVLTMNMRQWRHFFKVRAAGEAGMPHPQMREVTIPLLRRFKKAMPEIFGDIDDEQ